MLRTRLMTDSSTVMYIDQVTVRAQVCAINNAGSHVRGPLSALASRRSPQARCPQIPRVRVRRAPDLTLDRKTRS